MQADSLQLKVHSFLQGGGEMGGLAREFQWGSTSVGNPSEWPQSLRTTVSNLLRSNFPMFLWWGKDMIQFYNDAYRPSLGNEGKHPSALGAKGKDTWPEIWDIISPLLHQVERTGEATWMEDRLLPIFRNGQIENVYWTFSYSSVLDEEGKHVGILVTCTETTEKVNNLMQLKESEDQLRFAIDAAELGTWDYDPVTRKFTGNTRLKEWFGLQPEGEIDLSLAVAVMEETDKPRVAAAIQRALDYQSGGGYDIHYTIVHPVHNQKRHVHAMGRAWFNEEKVAYRFNGTLQDVTVQTQSHKILEESEARFRSLIEEAPVATCLFTGLEMRIEVANDTMLGYWGKDVSVIGAPLEEAVPELKGQPFLTILANVFLTGKTYTAKNASAELKVNGVLDTYYFDFTYKPLFDQHGTVYGIMNMAVDVTAQVLAMQKIEELMTQRTAELAEANLLLKQNNQELEQFAYIASHDLQEPLRKVTTFAQMLKSHLGEVDGRSANYFEKISSATLRMIDLIRDVLDFSQLSSQRQAFEQVDIQSLVALIEADFELLIVQKKAVIEYSALPTLRANTLQMRQLFSNLISNALKFSAEERPPVIIISSHPLSDEEKAAHKELRPKVDYCHITVADNGIGFNEEHALKIFSIFQRLHRKSEFAGTGIGLAICKKIVHNHHGEIWATSQPGEGAKFHIILPCPKQ